MSDCPSKLRWHLSGMVWDFSMILPYGKIQLSLIGWSGCRFAFATYQEMVDHYKYMETHKRARFCRFYVWKRKINNV